MSVGEEAADGISQPRHRVPLTILRWLFALSAYWFSSSFKWFILLVVILPSQVEGIVPNGERNSAWGMVFGLGAIWAVVGPSLFGYWSDLLKGRRSFILWGGGLTVVALLVLATSHTLLQISLGYLALQFSDDVGTGPYGAVIPELVPKRLRGLASGFVNVASLTGQIAVAITAILLRGNIPLIYGLIGLVTVVGALVTYEAMDVPTKPQAETTVEHREPFLSGLLRGWLAPWKHQDFVWVWFTRFLFSLGMYLVQPYLKFYLSDAVRSYELFGLDLKDPGTATSTLALTISVSGALSAALGGLASDRYGRKKVIYVTGAVMALLLVPFMTVHDFRALWVLSILFGLGFGGYLSASMAMAVDVLPSSSSYGKDMGIWQMSISSVQIVAGSAGLLVDFGNRIQPLLGYHLVFGLASLLFLLGTYLVKRVTLVRSSAPA